MLCVPLPSSVWPLPSPPRRRLPAAKPPRRRWRALLRKSRIGLAGSMAMTPLFTVITTHVSKRILAITGAISTLPQRISRRIRRPKRRHCTRERRWSTSACARVAMSSIGLMAPSFRNPHGAAEALRRRYATHHTHDPCYRHQCRLGALRGGAAVCQSYRGLVLPAGREIEQYPPGILVALVDDFRALALR